MDDTNLYLGLGAGLVLWLFRAKSGGVSLSDLSAIDESTTKVVFPAAPYAESNPADGLVEQPLDPWFADSDNYERFVEYASKPRSKPYPDRVKPYIDYLWDAGRRYVVSPYILLAIMEHESRSGTADSYSPKGPGGTSAGGADLGLMQINITYVQPWVAEGAWKDARQNIFKGAENYAYARRAIEKAVGLTGMHLVAATLSAYNRGAPAVIVSLQKGEDPDTHSMPADNYSRLVLAKLA